MAGGGDWEGRWRVCACVCSPRDCVSVCDHCLHTRAHVSHVTPTVFCSVKCLCVHVVGGTWESAQLGT